VLLAAATATPPPPRSGNSNGSSGGNGSSVSGVSMDNQFDSLKREATKLERSLEDKVARYQQVSASASASAFVRMGLVQY